jgi:hypothetical protein
VYFTSLGGGDITVMGSPLESNLGFPFSSLSVTLN